MIRFACPGCGAVYTVEDAKGGKTGKCPKCQAQFVIPAADPSASAPSFPAAPPPVPAPPPAPVPPPPPAADPNAPVEIAPCPKCQARLSVATADLGADVECPYCKTVYTARRPGQGGSASRGALPAARDDDRPSRRRREEDDEEDRPRRRRDEDEEEDRPRRRPVRDEAEEDRPSRRRRDEDDDDDRPRRRRDEDDDFDDRPRRRRRSRGRSSQVDTVARLNYVLGGLSLCCGCLVTGVGAFAGEAMKRQPGGAANNAGPIDPGLLTTIMFVLGVVYLLLSGALIAAGVGVSQRKNWGRILTFCTAGVGLILGVLSLVGAGANFIGGAIPQGCGGLVATGIWGGYGVQALMTMIKFGDEFE
ncbi:MAG: hypothetical protein U0871_18110 [Gemmataceae bacterium]